MLQIIASGLAHLGTWSYWGGVLAGVGSAVLGIIPGVGTPLMLAIAVPFVVLAIKVRERRRAERSRERRIDLQQRS